jgi:RNA-directed DNA polymerase
MTSEARSQSSEGIEAPVAKCSAESLAPDEQWMERICHRENLWQALKRVKKNGGSPGIDGMTVDELPGYLKQHWLEIREHLLSGTYQPRPVRRVELPKPDGGVRKLGVPTVLDRMIQQAVMQVLQGSWDNTFSESSLWVSSRTLGASGSGACPASYCCGVPLGGRPRSGKVL